MSFELSISVAEATFRDSTSPAQRSAMMPPRENIIAAEVDSPLGRLMIVAGETHLSGLTFLNRRLLSTAAKEWADDLGQSVMIGENGITQTCEIQLNEFFAGLRTSFEMPLQISGTTFQRRVWETLLTVPYGETVSYGDLAEMIDKPNAYRAVGNANGANRIAIIIPCHRVIAAGGKLGGYGGALWRKKALLELEQQRA